MPGKSPKDQLGALFSDTVIPELEPELGPEEPRLQETQQAPGGSLTRPPVTDRLGAGIYLPDEIAIRPQPAERESLRLSTSPPRHRKSRDAMSKRNQTRIVVCDKCGIRTRHEWKQWERHSFLLKIADRTQLVEGWVFTKCGRPNRVSRQRE